MELKTRNRGMIVKVVVLAAGLLLSAPSCGAEAEKPEKAERPDLPQEITVAVPAAVRKDLVAQAVQLCRRVFPKTPKEWFEKQYREYLDTPRWEVVHHAFGNGLAGPVVNFRRGPTNYISFPAGRLVRSLRVHDAPPGYTARKVALNEALRTARATLIRVLPRAADRRGLSLTRKKLVHSQCCFRWTAPVGPGHVDERSVAVWVSEETGTVSYCRLSLRERPAEPRAPFPRERVEKKLAKLEPGFESKRLGLYVRYTLAGPRLCWRYRSPRPGGRRLRRTILWDATTGKRIRSNAYDAEGKRHSPGHFRAWTSPEAYPWRTKKEVVERLEKTAAERAEELTGEETEDPARDQ